MIFMATRKDQFESCTVKELRGLGATLYQEDKDEAIVMLPVEEDHDLSKSSLDVVAVHVGNAQRRRLGRPMKTKKVEGVHCVDAKDVDLRRTGEYVEYRNDRDEAIKFLLAEANEDVLSITRDDWVWNDGRGKYWVLASSELAARNRGPVTRPGRARKQTKRLDAENADSDERKTSSTWQERNKGEDQGEVGSIWRRRGAAGASVKDLREKLQRRSLILGWW